MAWVVLGVVVLLLLWLVVVYNRMVSLRQVTGQAWSDVDVQLKLRHDLVPNLVETVKGYAAHERGTLEAVVQARNAALGANGPAAQAQADGQLGAAFFNNAVAEYNAAIQSVPAVFFAGSLGFTARTFFEVPESERAAVNTAPQVKF